LECTPLEATPISTSPAFMLAVLGRIAWRSTAPTAKPARSKSPLAYSPGISAVSPPIRAQPDSLQARAMPSTTVAAESTSACR
jgi:hypothetical protein